MRRFGNWLYNTLWANWTRRIATLLGLAVVGTLVYVLLPPPDEPAGPETCATGVVRRGGECIGVNGTGYDFGTPEIGKVARAIAEENRKAGGKPHVTIAMMLPLQPDIPAERRQLRSEIQGAYLAQYRANRGENVPLIRLVLANPGDGYAQQAKVVRQLGSMAKDKRHNLRAVTGFNLSLRTTEKAIGQLTRKHGIPVLASRISADGLANPEDENKGVPFPGLARIIPTNSQQARALASFHGGLDDAETVLIKDTRPNDIYVESLAEAFGRDEPGPPGPKDQPYRSPGITEVGTTGNDFEQISLNICESKARYVYFAGRPVHLRLFALKLAETSCHGKKYTIVSGSGAAALNRYMKGGDWETLRGGRDAEEPTVTVQYAAPAHPKAWEGALRAWDKEHDDPKSRPGYLTDPQRELRELEDLAWKGTAGDIGDVRLEDSRTMLVHDGVRTIARAVVLATSQARGGVPPLERVASEWPRLESKYRVNGTSGWICLTNAGNAYNKPVAVVELDPRTKKVDFVGIGWPENGRAQPDNCIVPSKTE
ncbi:MULTISPECIES: amino acid ABC transporter substrate-binding protein [Streptomyces]|uniref:amino acid ABC transporter substrate-binding protein n=1 Tax=Streptomyces TaxID=1883 RepID=UPI001E5819BF|nr:MULTISPECIES: amino acid ABC transporter substrate-binding protein [Streptomyces]UFQ17611.1 amino acid ABC transporter substrate-binding protein [Streptomyces huasconensis]WCL87216.1 amino acid ABC transporter substrate-binding protein [Streptomyces sp. JCM 35825]